MAAYPLRGKRIFVAGHRGMVGSALMRRLTGEGCDILTVPRQTVDLREQRAVSDWFDRERPHAVFMAAATVGGIYANDTRPGDFLFDNIAIATNVIDAAYRAGVEKLMFFGSSCIYPRLAPQPIAEESLLTGPLEPTNEWYAIAKIAALKLCEAYRRQHGCDFVSVMPTNLYGPGDNFDPLASHVLPALLRRIHEAARGGRPSVEIWGSGAPRREFLHVDDLADASVFLMCNWSADQHINIGCGSDVTIAELARLIARIVGFTGKFAFDRSKPDGTPRKLLDVSKLTALGWQPRIALEAGIEELYRWYLGNKIRG
ncbi:MAG TPA: GDP-L-fucose synthase [Stellaceae bacterium]|jgi:GDP-L-fucose synthase|nr:GDP-L-fucose synthase [Stellaceae bacterium]